MSEEVTYAKLRRVIRKRDNAAILALVFVVLWFVGFVAIGATCIFSTVPTWLVVTDGTLFVAIFVAGSVYANASDWIKMAWHRGVYEKFAWDPRTVDK